MNKNLVVAKEVGKMAAYAFVVLGLVGSIRTQVLVVREALKK